MERLFYIAAAVAALIAVQISLADDNYTFGPVPPPSQFSERLDDSASSPVAVDPKKSAAPATSNSISVKTDSSAAGSLECAVPKIEPAKAKTGSPSGRAPAKVIVEAGGGLDGKVAAVDARRGFVVLNFPLGQMPPVNSTLNVYRHGVKVGELSVTGPQRDDNTVADIVSGELRVGDAARNR